MRLLGRGFVFVLLMACSAAPVEPDEGVDEGAVAGTNTPGGETKLPNSIRWVRDSAEYQASVSQAYRLATAQVQATVARDRLANGSWGVVLDADETIIDNSLYNVERAFSKDGSSPASWNEWVRRKEGRAIGPAIPFLQSVKASGGRVFIVTNRSTEHCPATEENIRAVGIPFDVILCKSPGENGKNGRFEAVERGVAPSPLPATKIVLFVGDNILDFPKLDQSARTNPSALGEFGSRFVIIPNPMYGSFEPK